MPKPNLNNIRVSEITGEMGEELIAGVHRGQRLDEIVKLAYAGGPEGLFEYQLVVKGDDNRYYLGEFNFEFRRISRKNAEEICGEEDEA